MLKVGKYTGTIYPKNYPRGKIGECYILISDDLAEEFSNKLKGNKCKDDDCPGGCPANIKDPRRYL